MSVCVYASKYESAKLGHALMRRESDRFTGERSTQPGCNSRLLSASLSSLSNLHLESRLLHATGLDGRDRSSVTTEPTCGWLVKQGGNWKSWHRRCGLEIWVGACLGVHKHFPQQKYRWFVLELTSKPGEIFSRRLAYYSDSTCRYCTVFGYFCRYLNGMLRILPHALLGILKGPFCFQKSLM